jgi:GxxExxY protein
MIEESFGGGKMPELTHASLTERILQSAFEVHGILGSGFLEKVYENALVEELKTQGIALEQQKPLHVHYKGKIVGDYCADLVVEGKIIVELKALDKLTDIHEVQLKNYLRATGLEVGLLLNFSKSVEVRRKFVRS